MDLMLVLVAALAILWTWGVPGSSSSDVDDDFPRQCGTRHHRHFDPDDYPNG